ncbi:MAG: phosphatidate cytidylyltransferase [Rhodospirillaceae bacterium]|nr:phosphatidate cytidylyltransferase [Rhodospirillaceae bacterium]
MKYRALLKIRFLSVLIIVPPVLVAVWFGGLAFAILLAFIGGGIGYELSCMASIKSRFRAGVIISIGTSIPLIAVFAGIQAALVMTIFGTVIWFFMIFFNVSKPKDRLGIFAIGFLSLLAILSLILLRSAEFGGIAITIYLIAVVTGVDSGAYFAGRSIGGPKLAPSISPNKTWAGLAGGTIAAGFVGLLFFYAPALGGNEVIVLGAFDSGVVGALAISCIIAPLAQSGDLMESWIKRRRRLKDSGNLIPGHGGILDRVDGYLTAAPVVALIAYCMRGGA